MNAEDLLQHYARISEAPDAIPKLRRFVLDLAVRGKLVEQDAADEPASELLQRIAAEKARLVKAGEIRPAKARDPQMADANFDLPASWSWVALGAAFLYDAGDKCDPKTLDQSLWLLELEDVEKETGRLVERVTADQRASQSTKSQFEQGDILYGKLRPYLNKVIVADQSGYSTTEIVAIRPYIPICSEYCALALRRPDFVEYVTRLGQGTKMPQLRTEDAVVAPFPLPPLAEQHRIVAKVDELMALCDRLEEARLGREGVRDKLTAASLARMTAPDTSDTEFKSHARFALQTLPALTTRPDQIKPLRQTILNLAVRGKLVAQDAADEPAAELLNRAMVAKQRIRSERKIGRNEDPEFSESAGETSLPSHWVGAYLSDFGLVLGGKRLPAGVSFSTEPTDHIYIRVTDMKNGTIMTDGLKYISSDVQKQIAKYTIDSDDIYITIAGTIGDVGEVSEFFNGHNLTENAAKIVFREIDRKFLILVFGSQDVQDQFTEKTKQMAQPKLALKRILGARLPLHPSPNNTASWHASMP